MQLLKRQYVSIYEHVFADEFVFIVDAFKLVWEDSRAV